MAGPGRDIAPEQTGVAGIGTRIIPTALLVETGDGAWCSESSNSSDDSITGDHGIKPLGAQE